MKTILTAERVINLIREKRGHVSNVARVLGVSRPTLYKFIRGYSSVTAALDESRETMKDDVESVLYDKALAGEGWAVCFFLKTQAKDRGYVERQEITGVEGGAAIKLHWVADEDGHNPSPVAPGADADRAE